MQELESTDRDLPSTQVKKTSSKAGNGIKKVPSGEMGNSGTSKKQSQNEISSYRDSGGAS